MNARNLVATVVAVLATAATAGCAAGESPRPRTRPRRRPRPGRPPRRRSPPWCAHKYGETTVPEPPERVVTVGVTEQDILLAAGGRAGRGHRVVRRAAVRHLALGPATLLGDAEPEVLSVADGFEFERIAALEPDLIVGTNAGMTKKRLRAVLRRSRRPSPASRARPSTSRPWQDQTLQVARALGREADGQALVDEVEAGVRRRRGRAPGVGGHDRDVLAGWPVRRPALRLPRRPEHRLPHRCSASRSRPGSRTYAPEEGSQAEISAENVDLHRRRRDRLRDREQGDVRRAPGLRDHRATCSAVGGNRAVYTDETLAGAIYFDTPLSLQYVLERLTPMLEQAAARRGAAGVPVLTRPPDPITHRSTHEAPTRRHLLAGLSALAVAPAARRLRRRRRATGGHRRRRPLAEAEQGAFPVTHRPQVRRDHPREGPDPRRLRRA